MRAIPLWDWGRLPPHCDFRAKPDLTGEPPNASARTGALAKTLPLPRGPDWGFLSHSGRSVRP
jgi:hypothetical protein